MAIEEGKALLYTLKDEGFNRLVVSGASMGGEMATLIASSMQIPVGCASFMPAHSCSGFWVTGQMKEVADYKKIGLDHGAKEEEAWEKGM